MKVNLEKNSGLFEAQRAESKTDFQKEKKVNNFIAMMATEENDIFDLDCNVKIPAKDIPKLECSMQSLACSIGCNCSTSVFCTK